MITSHGLSHIVCLAVVSVFFDKKHFKYKTLKSALAISQNVQTLRDAVRLHVMVLYEMVSDRRHRL